MASNIQTYLNNIMNGIYGRDVRSSIHDAIELCYSDVSSGKTIAEEAASSVNTAVTNANNATNAANLATTSANDAATAANTAADNASDAASDADTAATAANSAATSATNATTAANTAATNANNAATAANEAADAANAAVEAIETMDIDVEAVQTAMANVSSATGSANTAATNANDAATAANNAAANANTKATAAETAANSCTVAITSANLAASNANAAKDSANTAANNANNARESAASAASSANSAANAANTAATNANAAANNATAKMASMDSKMFDAEAAINNANNSAASANAAATNANDAATAINSLTVDSEDVGPLTPSSATMQTVNGHKNIHFLLRQGNTGPAFLIKGSAYATVAALQEGVSDPAVGDQYNVGSAAPYNIYRWTGSTWEDQGTIGSAFDAITSQDVAAIQDDREIEGASTKVMKAEALTYLLRTLLPSLLNGKVDKVTGKGLSTNDFTTQYKNSIDSMSSNISVLSSSKVDKITGKGLSTNDFTNAMQSKVTLIGDDSLSTSATTIIGAINELASSRNEIYSNKTANSWTSQSSPTYADFPYRCSIALTGVTANMYAEVIFDPVQALSGNYAPVCQTYDGGVYIYSKVNTSITVPTIVIMK